ncbi:protein-L-isoaspartate O-methyltransferase [Ideonella sp. 4Y11]|uniref:Protein-L-isoaspartate O-methyltransferase n=1 Tax=Ideonella aquatica TaxID=2824119 RepID=A0A940YS47_9BURK|nr:protein-L-isoaspartate O-methyltransferase [Ideonella aquatica]MBQ0961456.1 protein-L-isoaspartate O-methyltransferase [Ideonella aquatica]
MNIEQARFNMIEQQIRPWDVLDPAVLALLGAVRREDFVPAACKALAFVDTEVPLAEGQVMLAPRVEARLLQEAKVQRHETVLEIGTGSGFQAALLGHRALRVITLEKRPALARTARENLQRAGLANVEVREADGSAGLAAEAPFDVILLSGSVAEVPQALLAQLKPGGRLLAIEGQEPVMRAVLVTRQGEAAFAKTELFDTVAQRLEGFAEPSRFRF